MVLSNGVGAEGSWRVQRIFGLPGGVPRHRRQRGFLRQGEGRAAASEARVRHLPRRWGGPALGEHRGTGEEVRAVRAEGRLRDDGPRGVASGGEGAPWDRPRDAGPDPARGRALSDAAVLSDLPALHAVLRSEPGGRAGGLRQHGRVEEGGGGPDREIPLQGNAVRARLLLDSRVPSEFLGGMISMISDIFFD